MKFTTEQVEFLLTKISLDDIKEAKDFIPGSKCKALKKDGSCCKYKAKNNTSFCGIHKSTIPIEDGEECPICLDSLFYENKISQCRTCKYKFHKKCLDRALNINHSCPCCRGYLSNNKHLISDAFEQSRISIQQLIYLTRSLS